MSGRTTQYWVKELARSKRGTPMHTAISEVVRLRQELEAMREDWERTAERSASARDSHEHPAKAAYARHLKSHQNVIRRLTHILGADNE